MFCWRASGRLDLASGWLQGKASLFAVFTFLFGHPCKWLLSVVRFHWAIRTGSEHDLLVVHIRWAVQTGIGHWLSMTGVRTLLLVVRTSYRETDYVYSPKVFKTYSFLLWEIYCLVQPFLFLIKLPCLTISFLDQIFWIIFWKYGVPDKETFLLTESS